jgi:hypothetical protein
MDVKRSLTTNTNDQSRQSSRTTRGDVDKEVQSRSYRNHGTVPRDDSKDLVARLVVVMRSHGQQPLVLVHHDLRHLRKCAVLHMKLVTHHIMNNTRYNE